MGTSNRHKSLIIITLLVQSLPVLADAKPKFVSEQLAFSAASYQAYQTQKLNKGGSNVVSIGNDPNCDVDININSIQQVIDGGATEIRLADTATYSEDILISNKSISVRGGFADCDDANNDIQQNTKTLITGTGSDPVISISGSESTYNINFQNLDIRNGQGSEFFPGGGISTLSSDSNITLDNVYIANNKGSFGGGIAINSGETSLTLIDTVVQFNEAVRGGGIYCTSPDASIAIFDDSGLLENHATGKLLGDGGGGMFLTNGCIASVFSGSSTLTNQYGISGNTSESSGGGVFLELGAKLSLYGQEFCFFSVCYGDNSEPVNITNNKAYDDTTYEQNGNGGGIFASAFNTGTEVYMQGVLINENHADMLGGGVYAIGSEVNIEKADKSCWDNIRCNFIQGNEASNSEGDETFGGGMFFKASTSNLNHTVFEDNRADIGAVLSLNYSSVNISGSVISNNGNFGQGSLDDEFVIYMRELSELTLEHVTMANNKVQTASIGQNSGAIINFYSSILYNPNTGPVIDSTAGVVSDIDCVIAHETGVLQALGGSRLLSDDPKFKAPEDRDYHLDAMFSPAVDFCAESNVLGDLKDMDGHARGWDDDSVPNDQNNPNYVFDAGADETYDNDVIFKSGLE